MRVAVASDHAAVSLKATLVAWLREGGHDVLDLGPDTDARVDYPDYGYKLAEAVAAGEAERGIALCGSGIGISIAVNRNPALRCALVSDPLAAALSREHNDANAIALGARLIGEDMARAPEGVKGAMLTCILSDTLQFRSPTTTPHDRFVAENLARELGVDIDAYATEMFTAKSDVSAFDDASLLRMDSKEYELDGRLLRVSVLETTAPQVLLDRKAALMAAIPAVAAEDGAHEVLMFIVDILNEQATLLVPNDYVRRVAERSFGVTVAGDTVVLPGIVSRKKQIIPVLQA